MRRLVFVVLALLAAAASAGPASAAYPVQPYDGAVLQTQRPAFLVYLDGDETQPVVEVFADAVGLRRVGSCAPATPTAEPGQISCQLTYDLAAGTYWWRFSWLKGAVRQTTPLMRFTLEAAPKAPTVVNASFRTSKTRA